MTVTKEQYAEIIHPQLVALEAEMMRTARAMLASARRQAGRGNDQGARVLVGQSIALYKALGFSQDDREGKEP